MSGSAEVSPTAWPSATRSETFRSGPLTEVVPMRLAVPVPLVTSDGLPP